MDADRLRGAVLRAWMDHAGVEGGEFGARLPEPVSAQAVSNWKTGVRSPQRATPVDLARGLGTNSVETSAFVGMWAAAWSVASVVPRERWAHNFPANGEPVWVWIRPVEPDSGGRARLWWGEPFQGEFDRVLPEMGVFITSPVSIPNPPVEVVFDGTGWADFGTGVIPSEVASRWGAEMHDGRTMLGQVPPTRRALDASDEAVLSRLFVGLRGVADRLGIAWSVLLPHLGIARAIGQPFEVGGDTASAVALADAMSVTGAQLERMRVGRGMTRAAAAEAVNDLDPTHPVSTSTVETVERTGRFGHSPMLLARLDSAYAADGRAGFERTFEELTGRGCGVREVGFPRWWVGPVWVQALSEVEGEQGLVDLVWGQWRRQQRVTSGTVLTTRRAMVTSPALKVRVPAGWRVVAGTGLPAGAVDIGHDWWPANIAAAASLLRSNLRLIEAANVTPARRAARLGRRRDEVREW